MPSSNKVDNSLVTATKKKSHSTTCAKGSSCIFFWIHSSNMPKKASMMLNDLGDLSGFDRNINAVGIVIGCQFNLTIVRFVTFAAFTTIES